MKYLLIIILFVLSISGISKETPKITPKKISLCEFFKNFEIYMIEMSVQDKCYACDHIMTQYGGGKACFEINCFLIRECK